MRIDTTDNDMYNVKVLTYLKCKVLYAQYVQGAIVYKYFLTGWLFHLYKKTIKYDWDNKDRDITN